MLTLSNKNITIGILENAGGRIVYLSYNGSENMLKSDRKLWDTTVPTPTPSNLEFTGYCGHEVWIGPQSEWWKHQDLNKEKKESTLFWPPDPYITYGRFALKEKTDSKVTLIGNESPISGLKFEKTYKLKENNVEITVNATNIRNEKMSWDLWMLTRIDGDIRTYVPVKNGADIKVSEPTHDYEAAASFRYAQGYFYFTPEDSIRGKGKVCTAKAFIEPHRPFIASDYGDKLLVISFEHHDKKFIHHEQSEVEIYNYASTDDGNMLELEYHAPFVTLAPGETMETTETWEIKEKNKQDNIFEQLDKIKQIR